MFVFHSPYSDYNFILYYFNFLKCRTAARIVSIRLVKLILKGYTLDAPGRQTIHGISRTVKHSSNNINPGQYTYGIQYTLPSTNTNRRHFVDCSLEKRKDKEMFRSIYIHTKHRSTKHIRNLVIIIFIFLKQYY